MSLSSSWCVVLQVLSVCFVAAILVSTSGSEGVLESWHYGSFVAFASGRASSGGGTANSSAPTDTRLFLGLRSFAVERIAVGGDGRQRTTEWRSIAWADPQCDTAMVAGLGETTCGACDGAGLTATILWSVVLCTGVARAATLCLRTRETAWRHAFKLWLAAVAMSAAQIALSVVPMAVIHSECYRAVEGAPARPKAALGSPFYCACALLLLDVLLLALIATLPRDPRGTASVAPMPPLPPLPPGGGMGDLDLLTPKEKRVIARRKTIAQIERSLSTLKDADELHPEGFDDTALDPDAIEWLDGDDPDV